MNFKDTDENNKKNGADDFWNIEFMLPSKKVTASFSRDTDTVEIQIAPEDVKPSGRAIPKRGSPKPKGEEYKAEPIVAYTPDNPLVKSITVWRWPSKYTFYERFRNDAIKYYNQTSGECEYVQLFSYMPQYMQLSQPQLSYYLWWRENVRKGVWLQTDYSYIFLYIYEIINLPDFISPAAGLELLCDVWLACRDEFPKLDRYMCEWVCDYCCINMLAPPLDKLKPMLGAIYEYCNFREFFIPARNNGDPTAYLNALLNLGSNYNWRQSKFYTPETAELFEKHITGAFIYTASRLSDTDKRFALLNDDGIAPVKLTRDAYAGSLCAYNVKRRIDIEYYACSRSPELRIMITDIVKNAENHIRGMLGVKSRFQTPTLDNRAKELAAEYFASFKPQKKQKSDESAEPDYMKLYDAVSTGITPDNAIDIERRSWTVTEKLVEAFAEPDDMPPVPQEAPPEPETQVETDTPADSDVVSGDSSEVNGDIIPALRMLLDGDTAAFNQWAKSMNLLPESAVELINEALYDRIGDICVEEGGSGYAVIDDYRGDVEDIAAQSM